MRYCHSYVYIALLNWAWQAAIENVNSKWSKGKQNSILSKFVSTSVLETGVNKISIKIKIESTWTYSYPYGQHSSKLL